MRVVFFGSGAFGLPTLEALSRAHDVALVVTQPDRPAGRNRKPTPTPIADVADSRGLPIIKPDAPNDRAMIEEIHALRADAFIVIAYGHKLSPALLADQFAINLHASLLPRFRGAAPIHRAIMAGEEYTGVSVITLAQRMDAGDVLGTRRVRIDPHETSGELHDRLALLGPEVVLEVLAKHEAGTLIPIIQDESLATFAPKLTKSEGTTSFDQPARMVQARVHGLNPWPGCTVLLDDQPLKLLRVMAIESLPSSDADAGTIAGTGEVACEPGMIRILSVQPPGGKTMAFDAFMRGRNISPGARFQPMTTPA